MLQVLWESDNGIEQSASLSLVRSSRGLARANSWRIVANIQPVEILDSLRQALRSKGKFTLKCSDTTLASNLEVVTRSDAGGQLIVALCRAPKELADFRQQRLHMVLECKTWLEVLDALNISVENGLVDRLQNLHLATGDFAEELGMTVGDAVPLVCSGLTKQEFASCLLCELQRILPNAMLLTNRSGKLAVGCMDYPIKAKSVYPVEPESSVSFGEPTSSFNDFHHVSGNWNEATITRGDFSAIQENWDYWESLELPASGLANWLGTDKAIHQCYQEFRLSPNGEHVQWRTSLYHLEDPCPKWHSPGIAVSEFGVVESAEDTDSGLWVSVRLLNWPETVEGQEINAKVRCRLEAVYTGSAGASGINFRPEKGTLVQVNWNGQPGFPPVCSGNIRVKKSELPDTSLTLERTLHYELEEDWTSNVKGTVTHSSAEKISLKAKRMKLEVSEDSVQVDKGG